MCILCKFENPNPQNRDFILWLHEHARVLVVNRNFPNITDTRHTFSFFVKCNKDELSHIPLCVETEDRKQSKKENKDVFFRIALITAKSDDNIITITFRR